MSKLSFSSSKIRSILTLTLILSIVCFAFFPALKGEFVFWDDNTHIYQNVTVATLDAEHIGDMFTSLVNEIYIPLTSLSFALEDYFFGRSPFVYHLNNLLLHLGVVAFIFWLGLRLGLTVIGSAAAALLFGIHPLHVESVAWITERKDVLYSFFYMAALLSYSRYLDFTKSTPAVQNKKQLRFLVLTVFFGILSMLAKPMALSLPLVLFLFDWFHKRTIDRDAFIEKIPLVIGIASITWVTYSVHARIPGETMLDGTLIWFWTLVFYLRQFVFPILLVPIYQLPKPIVFSDPQYFISIIVVILLVISLIRFRKHRWFIFSIVFFLFSIFFLLRFDEAQDTNIVADRFMYLPSLGFCYLLGYGYQRIVQKNDLRLLIPLSLIAVALLTAFTFQTRQQSRIWQNSISLWSHQLKFYPNEPIALNNLAIALREEEEYKNAEEIYRQAWKVHKKGQPVNFSDETIRNVNKVNYVISLFGRAILAKVNFIDAHYNLGNMFRDVGRIPEAIKTYEQTLKLDFRYKDAHVSIGELYQLVGDHKQAVFAYNQAIRLNPDSEDLLVEIISQYNKALRADKNNAYYLRARAKAMDMFTRMISEKPPKATSFFNLGYLYGGMGDYPRAISAYQMVLDKNPTHGNALYNLGNIYRDQGRLSDALVLYQKAVKVNPRNSNAYLNIGSIYERQGKQDQAGEFFQRAVNADSRNSRAHFNLGYVEERNGNLPQAAELYLKSIDLDPKNKEAHYNLGNVYARLQKNPLAIASYLKAVGIDPNYKDAWINLSTLSYKEGDFSNAVKYYEEATLFGYKAPQGYLNVLEQHR